MSPLDRTLTRGRGIFVSCLMCHVSSLSMCWAVRVWVCASCLDCGFSSPCRTGPCPSERVGAQGKGLKAALLLNSPPFEGTLLICASDSGGCPSYLAFLPHSQGWDVSPSIMPAVPFAWL